MTLAQATIEYLPIADNSVDLIFTDPPYAKDYLPCYQWLVWEASRILKPGGFVLAMCGGAYINRIFGFFDKSKNLVFYWNYGFDLNGHRTGIIWPFGNHKVNIIIRSKSILAYCKGKSLSRTSTISNLGGSKADKDFHEWGQDIESARYYIDCFSNKGDLVCDPFIGGGTTAVACMALQRRFVRFDIDMDALLVSRDRIADKRKENLHELPLFRNMNGTNGKAEIINPGSPRSDLARPDRPRMDCVESPSHSK